MKSQVFNFRCKKCGGMKYIGDEYHALDRLWVDVTCIQCAHSVDIEVSKLREFLSNFQKVKNVNKQNNPK